MDVPTPRLDPAELYDKRRAKDASRLRVYNKILEQIYHRIRTLSRLPQSQAYLLYTIPPFILGLPKIDMEDCVVYLIYQLRHAGYEIRFTHPNLLYISWQHHEKSYLVEQSPIMLSMLDSAERTQAEVERKEKEASRLLAPRKGGKKVRLQDPGAFQRPMGPVGPMTPMAPPRSAMETVLRRPPQAAPSAGPTPSASSYTPSASFLQMMMNPASQGGVKKERQSMSDYFQ